MRFRNANLQYNFETHCLFTSYYYVRVVNTKFFLGVFIICILINVKSNTIVTIIDLIIPMSNCLYQNNPGESSVTS